MSEIEPLTPEQETQWRAASERTVEVRAGESCADEAAYDLRLFATLDAVRRELEVSRTVRKALVEKCVRLSDALTLHCRQPIATDSACKCCQLRWSAADPSSTGDAFRAALARKKQESAARKCECAYGYCCDSCWTEAARLEPCEKVQTCKQPAGHGGACGPLRNTQTIHITEEDLKPRGSK